MGRDPSRSWKRDALLAGCIRHDRMDQVMTRIEPGQIGGFDRNLAARAAPGPRESRLADTDILPFTATLLDFIQLLPKTETHLHLSCTGLAALAIQASLERIKAELNTGWQALLETGLKQQILTRSD